MGTLTDFGDGAVLLPLSVVILTWLLWDNSRRIVGWWVIAVGLCIAATASLKIYLYACPLASDLISPSGHSSLSVLIYGAIAVVIAAQQRGWLRAAIFAAGAGLIVAIAASRFWLHAHSKREIAIGIVIGFVSLALFAANYVGSRTEGRRLRPFILSVIVVAAIFHGQELHAEAILHAISRHLHIRGIACAG